MKSRTDPRITYTPSYTGSTCPFVVVHITNWPDLMAAYSCDLHQHIKHYVSSRMTAVGRSSSKVFFLDGPYVLIDFSAFDDQNFYSEDTLCEHINALFMEGPVIYGVDHVFLSVQTTLLEWSDQEREQLADGNISTLALKVQEKLRLEIEKQKEQSYKTDMALASALLSQLSAGTLALAFQPIVTSEAQDEVIYWESLLRRFTNFPSVEFTTCAEHIEALERLDLISRLDRSIFWTHLDLLSRYPEIRLGCNISARSLKFDRWWRVLFKALRARPDVASRLTVEITETSSITADDEAIALLVTLKSLGCRTAIDDMGSRCSTLSFAIRARPDFMKIDKWYLRLADKQMRPFSNRILKHLSELCSDLSACVITEGIESEADIKAAIAGGADGLQGYFLARPQLVPSWLDQPVIVRDAFGSSHPSHALH